MVKIWLLAALSTAAFGSTITYNYTGQNFTRCNGTTTGSFFCPSQSVFTTDYNQASFTFSAPLAGGLSSANELTSPNLSAWTLSDALGNASFSSTDVNAVNELTTLSLSTDNSGALTGWQIQGPAFAPGSGTPYFGMLNPTVLGKGSGLQEADSFVNTNPDGYALGNSTPGSWTETLNLFQGGSTSAPVFLLGANPIGGVTGTISSQSPLDYYYFNWGGGAFSASASISGAPTGASYLFSMGAVGTCNSLASEALSGPGFSGNISFADLGAGQYCLGLDANNPLDPMYSLTFNTPIAPTPEPSGLGLLSAGLVMIGLVRHARRARQHS